MAKRRKGKGAQVAPVVPDVLRCSGCETLGTPSKFDTPYYECACGHSFVTDEGNRCPECNKFATKESEFGCTECSDGHGEEVSREEYKNCPKCGEPNDLESDTCDNCDHWFNPEAVMKKLKESEAAAAREAEREAADAADTVTITDNQGRSRTLKRSEYIRFIEEAKKTEAAIIAMYKEFQKLDINALLVDGFQPFEFQAATVQNAFNVLFSDWAGSIPKRAYMNSLKKTAAEKQQSE